MIMQSKLIDNLIR